MSVSSLPARDLPAPRLHEHGREGAYTVWTVQYLLRLCMEVLREEYGDKFFSKVFKSITADNGSEFSRLSELEAYGVSIYFAHPYSSWERAQNERHNRILRRYIPKGVSIDLYSKAL